MLQTLFGGVGWVGPFGAINKKLYTSTTCVNYNLCYIAPCNLVVTCSYCFNFTTFNLPCSKRVLKYPYCFAMPTHELLSCFCETRTIIRKIQCVVLVMSHLCSCFWSAWATSPFWPQAVRSSCFLNFSNQIPHPPTYLRILWLTWGINAWLALTYIKFPWLKLQPTRTCFD